MKKNLLFMMGAMLMMMAGTVMTACSSDEGVFNGNSTGYMETEEEATEDTIASPDKINVLYIQSDKGDAEECELAHLHCGTFGPDVKYPVYLGEGSSKPNNTREVYPLSLSAYIMNTSLFYKSSHPYTALQIYIESDELLNIDNLKAGDTFDSSVIRLDIDNILYEDKYRTYFPENYVKDGQIQVVGKKTGADGKSYLTLYLLNLKYYENNKECTYTFNAMIDCEICDYTPKGPDIESMRMPSDEMMFFMMDALNGGESQGRHAFFGEGSEQQECLIINSEEEFRKAYKGDKELPNSRINFEYCSLVIGRTYGENSGVSLGGFEVKDNGETYQVNVTLNKSVNTKYSYTDAPKDLYYWNIYPKMEKKPVVFNRIHQDVKIDPVNDVNARICNTRWILDMYKDADGVDHRVGEGYHGDNRYYIEFKEDGSFSGRINDTNDFSGSYVLPFVGKRAYYEDIEHGVINLSDWNVTKVADDNPVSQQFMRISEATQFKLVLTDYLAIYVSSKEYFSFRAAQ